MIKLTVQCVLSRNERHFYLTAFCTVILKICFHFELLDKSSNNYCEISKIYLKYVAHTEIIREKSHMENVVAR